MTKQLEALVMNEILKFQNGDISAAYLLHGWICNFVEPADVDREPALNMLTVQVDEHREVIDDNTEQAVQWVRDNVPAHTVGYEAILDAVG